MAASLSLWNCPLTRLASLRKGSARKSTSPRTRGEVEQAARPRLTAASKAELLPGLGHFHVGGEFATVRLSDGKSQVVNLRLCELVRSEERRVGKECRGRGWVDRRQK